MRSPRLFQRKKTRRPSEIPLEIFVPLLESSEPIRSRSLGKGTVVVADPASSVEESKYELCVWVRNVAQEQS